MWFAFRYEQECAWIFAQFNSFIHTIMYAYYTASTLKIRIPGKSMLTSLQISQFIVGLTVNYFYVKVPCFRNSFKRMFGWWFTWVYVGIVLLLFLNFYVKNYIIPARKRAAEKKHE
jgi:hypothetical protein